MANETSPILDRHVQEDIGRVFRERMAESDGRGLPESIETLLEALKGSQGDKNH